MEGYGRWKGEGDGNGVRYREGYSYREGEVG